jgi:hypothetical protein
MPLLRFHCVEGSGLEPRNVATLALSVRPIPTLFYNRLLDIYLKRRCFFFYIGYLLQVSTSYHDISEYISEKETEGGGCSGPPTHCLLVMCVCTVNWCSCVNVYGAQNTL